MKLACKAMLLIAGIIHLLPLSGVLGAENLASLYGVEITEPNLLIMMRHRAILFALLGGLLVCSAFKPQLRKLAIIGGLISATSFLLLAVIAPEYNASMARVIYADIAAVACLVIAAGIVWRAGKAH